MISRINDFVSREAFYSFSIRRPVASRLDVQKATTPRQNFIENSAVSTLVGNLKILIIFLSISLLIDAAEKPIFFSGEY